jgi:ADP-ribose pyrophosphatase YjhB (NUDIX family)
MIELQVGVKVLLQNREGKYLLLQRSPEKYPEVWKFGDVWDIVGGRIDVKFTLVENLKREIMEETQLELKEEPRLVAAQDIMRLSEKHVVRLTYTASIEGEPRLDADHIAYKWFSLEELKTLDKLDIYFKELLDKGLFG